MKRPLIAVAAALGAAGCSTLPDPPPSNWEVDADYVAAVEAKARRFGTKIYWLSMPLRPVPQPGSEAPQR